MIEFFWEGRLQSLPEKPKISAEQGVNRPIDGESLLFLMQEVLSKGASFRFRAKGWSMTPFIRDGDVVTVAPSAKVRPSVGKVVAFVQPDTGRLVIHRVIGRQGSAFLIQGDNASGHPDGFVYVPAILGCVTQVVRRNRRVYLGLGVDGYIIAVLSRNGRIQNIISLLRAIKDFLHKTPG